MLDKQLTAAAEILAGSTKYIKELDFRRRENIRLVGEALAHIFTILDQIYEERPDLMPRHLRDARDMQQQTRKDT
jgi:hypothetical protein